MKKLFLIAVLLITLTVSVMASDIILISPRPVTEILKGTPVIDGIVDNIYLKSYKVTTSGIDDVFHVSTPTSEEGCAKDSATAYYLHDNERLYVCIVVTDDKVYTRGKEWVEKYIAQLAWENDAVEARVYYEELGDKTQSNQYIFQADAFGIATENYLGLCKGEHFVATALTDTGFICEFSLPLAFDTKEGESIGVSIEIDDLNEDISGPDSAIGKNNFAAYGSQHPYENMVKLSSENAVATTLTYNDTAKHWGKKYTDYVTGTELFTISSDSFEPDRKITRAEFASILAKAYEKKNGTLKVSDSKKFSDVDYSAWYGKYIIWAADNGIINGKSETAFDPDATVTREEMALMLTRLAGLMKLDTECEDAVTFPDEKLISDYAKSSVAYCQKNGFINGKEYGFDPIGNATRAEVATIIYRFLTSLTIK